MLVLVKIWNCHGNRLRAGLAVWMPFTEAWTSTSLTGRCGRLVTLSDENRGTSGVRSPDEHLNKIRTTSCRSGSSCAVWVLSGSTEFLTMDLSARMRHPPPRLRAASEGGAGAARAPVSDPCALHPDHQRPPVVAHCGPRAATRPPAPAPSARHRIRNGMCGRRGGGPEPVARTCRALGLGRRAAAAPGRLHLEPSRYTPPHPTCGVSRRPAVHVRAGESRRPRGGPQGRRLHHDGGEWRGTPARPTWCPPRESGRTAPRGRGGANGRSRSPPPALTRRARNAARGAGTVGYTVDRARAAVRGACPLQACGGVVTGSFIWEGVPWRWRAARGRARGGSARAPARRSTMAARALACRACAGGCRGARTGGRSAQAAIVDGRAATAANRRRHPTGVQTGRTGTAKRGNPPKSTGLATFFSYRLFTRPSPWRCPPLVGHPRHWGGRQAPWDSLATSRYGVGWLPTNPTALRRTTSPHAPPCRWEKHVPATPFARRACGPRMRRPAVAPRGLT